MLFVILTQVRPASGECPDCGALCHPAVTVREDVTVRVAVDLEFLRTGCFICDLSDEERRSAVAEHVREELHRLAGENENGELYEAIKDVFVIPVFDNS